MSSAVRTVTGGIHTLSLQTTGLFGAAWVLVAGCLGVLGNVTSVWAGALVLTIGVTPPLVVAGLQAMDAHPRP